MKQIQLTKGYVALVDDEDYDRVADISWHAMTSSKTKIVYARGHTKGSYSTRLALVLHRVIMNAPEGLLVDHIDGDGLNCQKKNLRLCTHADNMRNRIKTHNGSSQYKGLAWCKSNKNWIVRIMFNRKTIHIGRFKDEIDGAKAYDAKARELFGQFARTNF